MGSSRRGAKGEVPFQKAGRRAMRADMRRADFLSVIYLTDNNSHLHLPNQPPPLHQSHCTAPRQPSFPRTRESRATSATAALDPRFRGDDEKRSLGSARWVAGAALA